VAFADVLGHDRIRDLLGRALAAGRLPPALLFVGPRGVGKRTLALAVARALLCPDGAPLGDACGKCPACHRTSKALHPDLFLAEPEGATLTLKIERVRDLVREIDARPFEAASRAILIDDAHTMTEQAQNALLKSLEEPPPTSHVFLVTPSPQTLLPTVRSRCQTLRLGPLPAALLEATLAERLSLSPAEARLRVSVSAGSLGQALAFEGETYGALRDELLKTMAGWGRGGVVDRQEAAESLGEREDLIAALGVLRTLLRDVAALSAGARPDTLLNADIAESLAPLAASTLGPRAAALAEATGETLFGLKGNASKVLSLDVLLDS
jgi:DNA polymerase III subunit delta'